jgi:predicted AAA+ superfamily ATPase
MKSSFRSITNLFRRWLCLIILLKSLFIGRGVPLWGGWEIVKLLSLFQGNFLENLPFFRETCYNLSIHKIYHEIKSAGLMVSKTSVYEFAEHLESIYMFLSLPKFSASPVKEFSGMPKYYSVDNGFNYALQGNVSENKGAFLENAVYLHLRRKHPFGNGLFYYKEKHECDFIRVEKLDVIELIQVCWSLETPETEKREIDGLIEAANITGCKNLKIITADSEKVISKDGLDIEVFPAWKYMLE